MKLIKIISIFILVVTNVSAKEANNDNLAGVKYIEGKILRTDKLIKIPKQLIRIIEDDFIAEFKKFDPVRASVVSRGDIILKSDRKYFDIKVYLNDNNLGSLSSTVKFDMSRGGGTIDLKEYVTNVKTKFNVKITVDSPEIKNFSDNNKNLRVYFFSNAKERKIKKEKYGAGCDNYMNVTKFYKETLSENGIQVSVNNLQYISLLAGTFYMYYPKNDEFYLGSLTFTDSRYPKLLCR